MMVRWSGEVKKRVNSQKYIELDIGGHETCKESMWAMRQNKLHNFSSDSTIKNSVA